MGKSASTGRKEKITPWELLEEVDVSPSKYFPVLRQKVKIHNGTIIDDYHITTLTDASVIVVITPKKEIVLVSQYRQGVGEITLELPAGQLDGRDPLLVAQLELAEEVGIVNDELFSLGSLSMSPPKATTKIHGYLSLGKDIVQNQELDTTENIEIVKVPLDELDTLIFSGDINSSNDVAFISLARLKFPEAFK